MKNKKVKIGAKSLAAISFFLLVLPSVLWAGGGKDEAAADNKNALSKLIVPDNRANASLLLQAISYDLKYYEEEGLTVELQNLIVTSNNDQLLAVSTGKLDLSNAAGLAAPLLFLEQGNDLVFFGGRMGEGHTLFANPENVAQYANFNITTLYGKKFGWYRGDTGGMLVRGWLATNGADISKITFVELDSYRTVIEAIRKGEIDVGNLSGFNRPTAVAQGLKEVLHLDSLVPNFPCCRLVTSGKILKERREDLVGFLKAQIRAYKVFKEDHEKTLDITAKYFDVERNVRETIFYTYGHYNFSPDPEKKRIVDFYSGIAAAGFAKGTADVASHIDTSLYRDALDQILIEYPGDPFYLEMKKHFDENN